MTPDSANSAMGEVAVERPEARRRRHSTATLLGDRIFTVATLVFALAILALLFALAVELITSSAPALARFGFGFLTSTAWDPPANEFGALPFIYGTVVSSVLALVVAVPLSLGVALCLSELAPPWLASAVGFMVELLAAIPSVVYGLWAIFELGPWLRNYAEPALGKTLGFLPLFQGPHLSVSMLTAGVVLAIMILPYIASVCTDVFRTVPQSQRESAFALGATRWEMIRMSVLPAGLSGVIGAVILGLGRALGETIAVAMVIGNSPTISASLFMPASTLASVIANEFAEAINAMHQAALIELGLVLLGVGVIVNVIARLLVLRATARRFAEEA